MSGVSHDWAKASGLADRQAFPSRFHNCFRHLSKRVDFENSLHLGEETVQQTKVATCHPDDRRDFFRLNSAITPRRDMSHWGNALSPRPSYAARSA